METVFIVLGFLWFCLAMTYFIVGFTECEDTSSIVAWTIFLPVSLLIVIVKEGYK